MTAIPKDKPEKDAKYLRHIAKYGCVVSQQEAITHHLIGYKQGSGKESDYLAFPLNDIYHTAQHETGIHRDVKAWEEQHGLQTWHIKRTLHRALENGHISVDKWIKYTDICNDLEKRFR
jgi:hypothetical protein